MTDDLVEITDEGVKAFAAKWPPIDVDDETRALTTLRADELVKAKDALRDEHAERIRRECFALGRRVKNHELTLEAGQRRRDAFADVMDESHPLPMPLVPWREAHEIANAAFWKGSNAK